MRKIVSAAVVAALCSAAPALAQMSGPNSPTITHDNPSSCLGAERAGRNSNGGDRAQGGFGAAQSAYVHELQAGGTMSYGEFLQTWMQQCANAPGTTGGTDNDDSGD
jgi:hypothetical protein